MQNRDVRRGLITKTGHFPYGLYQRFDGSGTVLATWFLEEGLLTLEGKHIRTIHLGKDSIGDVAFSPDMNTMAVGFRDKVQLWNYQSGVRLYTLTTSNRQSTLALKFSDDSSGRRHLYSFPTILMEKPRYLTDQRNLVFSRFPGIDSLALR